MFHSDFDLYDEFFNLSIIVQDEIIQNIINQKVYQVSNENITKLKYEVELGRINFTIQEAVKKATPKPKPRAKKVVKKKVVKVEELPPSSESSQDIFDLEL
jgi:hypothetical protein